MYLNVLRGVRNNPSGGERAKSERQLVLKLALLIPVLASLLLYTPSAGSYVNLFEQFPPARRVFRGVAEFVLLIYCSAFSLYVWENNEGGGGRMSFSMGKNLLKDSIGHLLFAPPPTGLTAVDTDDNSSMPNDEIDVGSGHVDLGGVLPDSEDSIGYDMNESRDAEEEEPIQAVSSLSVLNAAMDLTLLSFGFLLLFALSSSNGENISRNDIEGAVSSIAPSMVFPLVFFLLFVAYAVFPWSRRRDFWSVLYITPSAPFFPVTFRDGFVGDILTSTVRPLQDIAFTFFYIFAGLEGWWTAGYDLNHADRPLERSWLLHKVVLPACMVSPLWWRFCQNLRQSFDAKKRWPYLGNAFKYLIAAEVGLFGVFNPSHKQQAIWLVSFTCATLYQIWWDIMMDWELFSFEDNSSAISKRAKLGDVEMTALSHEQKSIRSATNAPLHEQDNEANTSSTSPFVREMSDTIREFCRKCSKIRLRPKRLYQYDSMYIAICIINILLRFCWTLSFIPPSYLNQHGQLEKTFGSDVQNFINPVIASAEIFRRTLWGLLRVELEALKQSEKNREAMDVMDMKAMEVKCRETKSKLFVNDLSNVSELNILRELSVWAVVFTSLGILAAAH